MGPYENPTVLITRPAEGSARFLAGLRDAAGPFVAVVQPAFEIAPTGAEVPPFDVAIFTSRAGVEMGPHGDGRVAWCVGDATGQAAEAAGYEPRSAGGDVEDLLRLILARRPVGRMVHLRGENSRGDVTARLVDEGLRCEEIIVYAKAPQPVDAGLRARLQDAGPIIIPLFSAETVSIIASWGAVPAGCHAVAISDAVAAAADVLTPCEITTSSTPTAGAMTQAVRGLIA